MIMKHKLSGTTYNIIKVFVDDCGAVKVLYYDAKLERWMTEPISYFEPIEE